MCRFAVYISPKKPILLADLLTRPTHSVVKQSHSALESVHAVNADGFGVAWYAIGGASNESSCLFTSILPAWNDMNLKRISEKTRSSLIFAHVRAASPGLGVSQMNCHPFVYGKYTFMHNGGIGRFRDLKQKLVSSLRSEIYQTIQGTTDSEHAFMLFLNHLPIASAFSEAYEEPQVLLKAFKQTIANIIYLQKQMKLACKSLLNFAVTDGQTTLVSKIVLSTDDGHAQFVRSLFQNLTCNVSTRVVDNANDNRGQQKSIRKPIENKSSSDRKQKTKNKTSTENKIKNKSTNKTTKVSPLQRQKSVRKGKIKHKVRTEIKPRTLYFSCGSGFEKCSDGEYRMRHSNMRENVVIIASERLSSVAEDWIQVPINHIVVVGRKANVLLFPIDLNREYNLFHKTLRREKQQQQQT